MAPQKEVVLKLSSMRYLKPGVSEEEFHEYASKHHAPKAALIQARHGALNVTQYHTPTACRQLLQEKLPWAVRPGWKIDDHDITISVWVRSTDDMLKIVMDPDFQALVAEDEMTTDGSKGTISAGWEEMYVEDGKIVNVEEGKSTEMSLATSWAFRIRLAL
ncbi:hypothetical protein BU26DRAFT_540414 [Trematosphaeria pertusa]|uniref:EthD domain-containing protein n=1 Tax=Trematosphaeria pertusa TaxID=390896 RepID=A0A6A6IGD0_9PLEO|nr:uncharacterized protein BU26DRAFT_540414 [Trematosphaeria pertusa]KAF2248962.1 hypothetical protein BU26DRAFT_540414 [Trematosphaeria pertusa]